MWKNFLVALVALVVPAAFARRIERVMIPMRDGGGIINFCTFLYLQVGLYFLFSLA